MRVDTTAPVLLLGRGEGKNKSHKPIKTKVTPFPWSLWHFSLLYPGPSHEVLQPQLPPCKTLPKFPIPTEGAMARPCGGLQGFPPQVLRVLWGGCSGSFAIR